MFAQRRGQCSAGEQQIRRFSGEDGTEVSLEGKVGASQMKRQGRGQHEKRLPGILGEPREVGFS